MPGVRPPMGGAGGIVPPPQSKGSGAMGIIMPLYTVGIVVFFVYTIMKVSCVFFRTLNIYSDLAYNIVLCSMIHVQHGGPLPDLLLLLLMSQSRGVCLLLHCMLLLGAAYLLPSLPANGKAFHQPTLAQLSSVSYAEACF